MQKTREGYLLLSSSVRHSSGARHLANWREHGGGATVGGAGDRTTMRLGCPGCQGPVRDGMTAAGSACHYVRVRAHVHSFDDVAAVAAGQG